ncbi:MAG TPA: DUF1285 domain-containing protein [Candidatus Binatia bacterium]|nr:DUF1285 domain-containing protein [Candidatus Binatia bacterium]
MKGFWAIESHTIRFGKDGRWYADDAPIENRRIADLFSRHVVRRDDGAWWLVVGDERAPIVVDDTPFVVARVDPLPHGGFNITLNDGTREPLDAGTLRLGDEDVLYCDVKQGSLAARFLRSAQADLLAHAEEDAGRFFLPAEGGVRHEIARARVAAR